MKTVEVRVDALKGRLRVKGALFAGSRVELSLAGYAGETAELGLYVFDRRAYEEPAVAPRTRVFPPPGLKCVATSERSEDGKLVLDLNTQEVLDAFSDGKRVPGSIVCALAYLWDRETPEVVAEGATAVEWSPVYFRADHTPVTMKGDPGEKGDPGRDGEDAIVGSLPPGDLVVADRTGKRLAGAGKDAAWLAQRVAAYRNANGALVLTSGYLP